MSDVTCPYCRHQQEISHDDGYGYRKDETHNQLCPECEKEFDYTTEIYFSYRVYCKNGDHIMKLLGDRWPDMYHCSKCDFFEMKVIK